jgi:hypothetical protein
MKTIGKKEKAAMIIIVAAVIIITLVVVGFNPFQAGQKEIERITAKEEEVAEGPTLTLVPSLKQIYVSEGYIVDYRGEAGIDLPDDYFLPRKVIIYDQSNTNEVYIVLLNASLPADKTRAIFLSEEMTIEDLEPIVTRVDIIDRKI